MNYNFKTLVILGPATKKTRKIKKIEKGFKENIKIIKEPKNFQNEISKAEIGIIGGGISTYEFARLKIPFGIICQYRHQIITSREWAKKNIAENLGMFNFELNTKTKSFLEKIDQDRLRLKTMKKTEFSDSRKVLSEILRLKDD